MADTILLLILSGEFMLLNHIIQIIINRATANQTGLCPALTRQFINVVARCLVLDHNSVSFHICKVFSRFVINLRIIKICVLRKIHLRTVYMKEGIRVLISDRLRLFSCYYIIWKCRYPRRLVRDWSECTKCLKNSHVNSPLCFKISCVKYRFILPYTCFYFNEHHFFSESLTFFVKT